MTILCLCLTCSPCCKFSCYNNISIWPYYIVINYTTPTSNIYISTSCYRAMFMPYFYAYMSYTTCSLWVYYWPQCDVELEVSTLRFPMCHWPEISKTACWSNQSAWKNQTRVWIGLNRHPHYLYELHSNNGMLYKQCKT